VTTTTRRRPRSAAVGGTNGEREVRGAAGGGSGKLGNGNGNGKHASLPEVPRGETAAESPDWRRFVGRWLEAHQCKVEAAPRGDWEVVLSAELQKRWRRQRVLPWFVLLVVLARIRRA